MPNEYDIVRQFEQEIAEFSGARYGVSVESCTSALFLACWYQFNVKGKDKTVYLPKRTYPGVPWSVIHAGGRVKWITKNWSGQYEIQPIRVIDSAKRFCPDLYKRRTFCCLSFHSKKRIAIGRGGMILTDCYEAMCWFKRARFDGRRECALTQDDFDHIGWNMYMTPEQAARGLVLFHANKTYDDLTEEPDYPDLSKYEIFTRSTH